MVKASLLRICAQKYATGQIKTGDYLAYRRALLDAIDNDEPLPELPEEWVHLQGSVSSPELQSLMVQMHQKDESDNPVAKLTKKQLIGGSVVLLAIIVIVAAYFVLSDDSKPEANKAVSYQTENQFVQNIKTMLKQSEWTDSQIEDLLSQWQKLSPMEHLALKRESSIQQFKSKASSRLSRLRSQSGDSSHTELLYQILSELN